MEYFSVEIDLVLGLQKLNSLCTLNFVSVHKVFHSYIGHFDYVIELIGIKDYVEVFVDIGGGLPAHLLDILICCKLHGTRNFNCSLNQLRLLFYYAFLQLNFFLLIEQ